MDALFTTLSSEERLRAERFAFSRHRDAYVVARGLLRRILGRYLGCKAALVSIVYGPYGKPMVNDAADLAFNLSHSESMVAYAFNRGVPIGIDIEYARPLADLEDVARRFFHPAEYEQLRQVAPEQKIRAFYNCWTRKEAFIKALGKGASHPLDSFQVTLLPGDSAAFVSIDGQPASKSAWSLQDVSPSLSYVAAIAIQAEHYQLHTRLFERAEDCATFLDSGAL